MIQIVINTMVEQVSEKKKPILTKYEYTRIRGIRLQQLVDGMPSFVKRLPEDTDADIFTKELAQGKIPFCITRPTGAQTSEKVPVSIMDVRRFI